MSMSMSVKLTSRFAVAAEEVRMHAAKAVAQTGRDIAETAKAGMFPNHFLDTGLSQETTQWTQTDEMGGAVQIPTEYASFPEFGTVRMDPRPVLTPAVLEHFPASVVKHFAEPTLPDIGPIEPLLDPIARP